jgi:hypothetical protein
VSHVLSTGTASVSDSDRIRVETAMTATQLLLIRYGRSETAPRLSQPGRSGASPVRVWGRGSVVSLQESASIWSSPWTRPNQTDAFARRLSRVGVVASVRGTLLNPGINHTEGCHIKDGSNSHRLLWVRGSVVSPEQPASISLSPWTQPSKPDAYAFAGQPVSPATQCTRSHTAIV